MEVGPEAEVELLEARNLSLAVDPDDPFLQLGVQDDDPPSNGLVRRLVLVVYVPDKHLPVFMAYYFDRFHFPQKVRQSLVLLQSAGG